ncbi:methyltransferase domain-containing protein [Streptomyces antimycoticus]|uniref:methyltransferase domain-containing protein n=1 Tax=Streptomyces antimycoticus TaxID=68175 RepID=UPI0036BE7A2B
MNWSTRAIALAGAATHRHSRWAPAVAATPRHLFVPRWWERGSDGWELHDGPSDPNRWLDAAYRDTSLVTRVGPLHADYATEADRPHGRPTSSATLPSLVVGMFQHARIDDGDRLLDVGTGSGYGAALAARRLSDKQVTSVDVDLYLTEIARKRMSEAGVAPTLDTIDATGDLPYDSASFDRIVATVSVRTIPASWLRVLRPGGRLVTTIAGTALLVTAEKDKDGGATGRVEWGRAGFMHARHGDDYPPGMAVRLAKAAELDGDDVTRGPYPVVDVANAWDLASMLDVEVPGIEHEYREDGEQRVALMAHADGSWARATATGNERPTVHQGGPRRLWDALEKVRDYWLSNGELPVRGARVDIMPDGRTFLGRGKWSAELS